MFVLEPLFALLMCASIYAGIAVWRRYTSEFLPVPEFERWCSEGPMILAVRCSGDAHDARMTLRQLIAPDDEVLNLQGGAPWQYYHYEVEVRMPSESVITVHIRAARIRRGAGKDLVDARRLVEELLAKPELGIEEVWLHGQLHPSDAPSRLRDRIHWIGTQPEELSQMIGLPAWTARAEEPSAA